MYGEDWPNVSAFIGTKDKKQCADRWGKIKARHHEEANTLRQARMQRLTATAPASEGSGAAGSALNEEAAPPPPANPQT